MAQELEKGGPGQIAKMKLALSVAARFWSLLGFETLFSLSEGATSASLEQPCSGSEKSSSANSISGKLYVCSPALNNQQSY